VICGESQAMRIVVVADTWVIDGHDQRFCFPGFVTDQDFEVFEILREHTAKCTLQHIRLP